MCSIEQTTGHASSDAAWLEIPHAQNFPATPISAAKVDSPVGTVSRSQSTRSTTARDLFVGDRAPAVARAGSAPADVSAQDRAFIELQNAYRAHGGLSRLHGLNAVGGVRSELQGCGVEHLVAAGTLFGFQWCGAMWIPMFQFAMPGPTVAAGPRRVAAELGRSFDGWALASWFVQPNAWLAGQRPIECLASRLPDVLEAARADRFVTTG